MTHWLSVWLSSLCALLKKYKQELFSISVQSLTLSLPLSLSPWPFKSSSVQENNLNIEMMRPLYLLISPCGSFFCVSCKQSASPVFIFPHISSGWFLSRRFLLHRLLWHLKWKNNYARKVRGPTLSFLRGPPSDLTMHLQKILKNILQSVFVRSTAVKCDCGGHIFELLVKQYAEKTTGNRKEPCAYWKSLLFFFHLRTQISRLSHDTHDNTLVVFLLPPSIFSLWNHRRCYRAVTGRVVLVLINALKKEGSQTRVFFLAVFSFVLKLPVLPSEKCPEASTFCRHCFKCNIGKPW